MRKIIASILFGVALATAANAQSLPPGHPPVEHPNRIEFTAKFFCPAGGTIDIGALEPSLLSPFVARYYGRIKDEEFIGAVVQLAGSEEGFKMAFHFLNNCIGSSPGSSAKS